MSIATERVTVRLQPPETRRLLEAWAARRGVTISEVIRQALVSEFRWHPSPEQLLGDDDGQREAERAGAGERDGHSGA